MIYSCLAHDIVAHETTHAILDGMHRRFSAPSNPDVLALHEGFADIVALMQHFTMQQVLEDQIARTRGDIEQESMLGSLAVQFGHAIGGRGALRDAIGKFDANGVWHRLTPDPAAYQKVLAPHERGAILVAAVFDAFLAIYKARIADLLRIYTGGTGLLPAGAIHPDLVRRLASEAAKSAGHVLNMCIRALDYIPPVDVTFGDYLRGIITADYDLVRDDDLHYRVAFVEAFRRHGIYPQNVQTLSVETLRWQGLDLKAVPAEAQPIVDSLKQFASDCFYMQGREELFHKTREHRRSLHEALEKVFAAAPDFPGQLGLDPKFGFEVHELRRSLRTGPDGNTNPEIVVALTQTRTIDVNGPRPFLGGSTIVLELTRPAIKYCIRKRVSSTNREERTAAFLRDAGTDPLKALMLTPDSAEPFALLHSLAGL